MGRTRLRLGCAALLLALALAAGAGEGGAMASRAAQAYGKGDYAGAAELYELMASSGADGAEVQYDLGNCRLKQGDVARAIVAYRRALLYDGDLEPARRNLTLARTLLPARKVAWQPPPWEAALARLGTGGMAALVLGLAWLANAALWAALLLGPGLLRRASVGAMTGLLVATGVAGAFLYYQVRVLDQRQGAVVVAPSQVYERPQGGGAVLATLPPGSEVLRVAQAGRWSLLLWGEGSGWAESATVEVP